MDQIFESISAHSNKRDSLSESDRSSTVIQEDRSGYALAKCIWHGVWMRINTQGLVNGHSSSTPKVQKRWLRLTFVNLTKEN